MVSVFSISSGQVLPTWAYCDTLIFEYLHNHKLICVKGRTPFLWERYHLLHVCFIEFVTNNKDFLFLYTVVVTILLVFLYLFIGLQLYRFINIH